MAARKEISAKLQRAYKRASKSDKSDILDTFCDSTGLSRSTARRYLHPNSQDRRKTIPIDRRKRRATKYSHAAKEKLLWLWRVMCMPCGKYLVADRALWIEALEAHGELVLDQDGWTASVREQILQMSAATVDRYLQAQRHKLRLKGICTTKPGALLRNSIQIRKAGDEVEKQPGFFEADTVAHCGPTLKGEFARTLSWTDVHTGWIHLEVLRNNAHVHIRDALDRALACIPYQVQGLDCDNGSEFINYDVTSWAHGKDIFFTRARPYRKNDQAHVESKNNHIVRRYGFYYRYDTQAERQTLAMLWQAVCLKMNYFTATKKPIGWTQDAVGRRKRVYDHPTTPLERLLEAGVLSHEQERELLAQRASLNPATITRDIVRLQSMLTGLARSKTEQMTAVVEAAKSRKSDNQRAALEAQVKRSFALKLDEAQVDRSRSI